ncbi:hypothetical protein BN1058_01146 [Paraliobacillus sp. PM-2]|uniref:hypothetical protein n=1 Tax=Paraliobacillus sp. PM-2 TaxID=1462524 RepID=UPI00061C73D5|nr:hypothetical protein [Paraliobacillus sp. PM-2]CQR46863.1 hypothetical protein BN1058_01146 [Paraliobacillus sp. PM-2]
MEQNNGRHRSNHIEDAPKFGEDNHVKSPVYTEDEMEEVTPISHQTGYDEEFAQEFTANDLQQPITPDPDKKAAVDVQTGFGWLALVMAIASLFILPVFLSVGAIIIGFIAKGKGADTLGNTAIIIGALSFIITLFIIPMV